MKKQNWINKTAVRSMICLFCMLGVILCSAISSFSQPHTQQIGRDHIAEKINAIIDEEIEKTDLTGAAIAVFYKGSPLITRGVGYADETNQIKVNEHTGFRIGSITKLFTAISIMKLVEDGVISLDESIFKYLPDYQPQLLPGVRRDNRIRDLLTHHNGIPSFWLKDQHLETPSLEPLRELPLDLSEDFLVENRREVHSYTNAAYALAGLIVERASGQSYDDFIKEHFFDELNMVDAHVFLPENRENIALPHYEHEPQESLGIRNIPAGAIISSATDMHSFMEMIIDTWHGDEDDVIEPTTLWQMSMYQHHQVKYDIKNYNNFMGLGFFIEQDENVIQIGHGGNIETFNSELQILPDLGIGVFISTNGSESERFYLTTTKRILKFLSDLEKGPRNTSKEKDPPIANLKRELPMVGNFLLGLDDLDDFRELLTLSNENNSSYLKDGHNVFELLPTQCNSWSLEDTPLTLHLSSQFKGYYLKNTKSHNIFNLIPVKQYEPSLENWDRFLGREFSYQDAYLGKLLIGLRYDTSRQFYYTHFRTPDNLFEADMIQHIISDTLLQGQGKGRNSSLVTQFLGEDTVKFCGLTFSLEESSNELRKSDPFINQPHKRKEAIRRLKSIFPSSHINLF